MGDLTKHFSRSEFACHCGCGYDDVDINFVLQLEETRYLYGLPMVVNSGCRCVYHNGVVGGNKASEHMDGQAADIAIKNSYQRDRLVWAAHEAGFKRIGLMVNAVHLDNDQLKPQGVMWLYPPKEN